MCRMKQEQNDSKKVVAAVYKKLYNLPVFKQYPKKERSCRDCNFARWFHVLEKPNPNYPGNCEYNTELKTSACTRVVVMKDVIYWPSPHENCAVWIKKGKQNE